MEVLINFLLRYIKQQVNYTMKKNISLLVATIENSVSMPRKGSFKIYCSDAHKYTNKILVDAKAYDRPTRADLFVEKEMKEYQPKQSNGIEQLKQTIKEKLEKPPTLDYQLTQLELRFSFLLLQEVQSTLRFASRSDLEKNRPKLIKLESNMSFTLESEDIEPHIKDSLEDFLVFLSDLINKTAKVY